MYLSQHSIAKKKNSPSSVLLLVKVSVWTEIPIVLTGLPSWTYFTLYIAPWKTATGSRYCCCYLRVFQSTLVPVLHVLQCSEQVLSTPSGSNVSGAVILSPTRPPPSFSNMKNRIGSVEPLLAHLNP